MPEVFTIWIHRDAEKRLRETQRCAEMDEQEREIEACLMYVIQRLKMWAVKVDGGYYTIDGVEESENIFVPEEVVEIAKEGRL